MTQTVSIGDVIKKGDLAIHNRLRAPLNSRQRTEKQGGYPYYGATGQMDSINEYRFDGLYVLVAEDGTVYGKNSICPMVQRVRGRFWVSNHAHVLQGNDEIDTRYLALALEASDVRSNITGAVQLKLSKENLFKLKIYWPDRDKRETILNAIHPIDEKIELNRQMNETLEQMGQALFRHYFIDNPEAEKWSSDYLDSQVNIRYGKNLPTKNLQEEGYPVFGGNGQIGYYEKYIYETPMVLVACRGAASGDINISKPKSFVTNNSLALEIKGDSDFTFEYLRFYSYSRKNGYHEFVSGSAQPQITVESLSKCKVPVPPKERVDSFTEASRFMVHRMLENDEQIQTLTTLRNTLLPRLISGKAKV